MQANIALAPHDIHQGDGGKGNLAHPAPFGMMTLSLKAAGLLMATFSVMASVPGIMERPQHMMRSRKLSYRFAGVSTQQEPGTVSEPTGVSQDEYLTKHFLSELTNVSQQEYLTKQVSSKLAHVPTESMSGMVSDLVNVSEQRQGNSYVGDIGIFGLFFCNYGNVAIRLILRQQPAYANSLMASPWVAVRKCHYFDERYMVHHWVDKAQIRCFYARAGQNSLHSCISHNIYYQRNSPHRGSYYCSAAHGLLTQCVGITLA